MQGDKLENAVRQNIMNQVMELRQLEPVLSRAYDKGELLIVGAVYILQRAVLNFLAKQCQIYLLQIFQKGI